MELKDFIKVQTFTEIIKPPRSENIIWFNHSPSYVISEISWDIEEPVNVVINSGCSI
jgi:hypothetical protein